MIIRIYSDASYISETEARSRGGKCFFLGPKTNAQMQEIPSKNGPVHVDCSITRNIMASATETEIGGLFEKF